MEGSIGLSAEERKALLLVYCRGGENSRQAHVLLLLDHGLSWREVSAVLFASNDLIARCVSEYRAHGIQAIVPTSSKPAALPWWLGKVVQWLTHKSPEDFGYYRRRWTCAMLAEVLAWEGQVRVGSETIRRSLARMGFVWRRPRPVVGLSDPDRPQKLQQIQRLLANLPSRETAVFQDEVDVHLNPKIGSCWMRRGQQTQVVTPGNNVKRHLAGSLAWRTGRLLVSPPGTRRNANLFVTHLDELRKRLRTYAKIHVICDNAAFHQCRKVREYVERWSHRLALHFLPKYSPDTNPIERVWWHLHETITRNHRCQTIEELIEDALGWLDRCRYFPIETSLYATKAA
jgi:transposase